ncbi:MAG: peptidoglycan editing factor PgeF [Lachnospiraceae bacterium]|nr:peptidoglycan editing factor PgeF [Lachnospiraceae bacterium]
MQWIRKKADWQIKIKEQNGVTFLSFPVLEETGIVRHGFSTRLGGVSEGMFASMNLSFQRGDDRERVMKNYQRIAAALGTKTEHMVLSQQTHTTNIRVVTAQDKGKGIHKEMDYRNVDGMVTNEPGIMLVTSFADCVPIYLVDIARKAIGLCHSGWRGTVGKISHAAIKVMKEQYGTRAEDLRAAIGPSICQDCYEVSEDVIEEFAKVTEPKQLEQIAVHKGSGKYQLDLWKANQYFLEEAGVLREYIQVPDLCTCCNSEYLFSHRASQGKRGNLAAFLELL